MNTNYWTPAVANRVQTERPSVGDVVAYARAAWRVEHVQDATPTDEEAAALAAYRPGFRDKISPYRVSLRRLHGPRHSGERRSDPGLLALRVRAGAYVHPFPVYRDGRVPLCSCFDFLPVLQDGDSYCGPSCGGLASVGSCFIPDSARERASYTGSTGV